VNVASLTTTDALQRFSAQHVAVLGTADGAGTPHLVPVTFAVIDDCVVFAVDHKPKGGRQLRRLENIEGRAEVSFLVDHYDDDWEHLWWVRVDARATVVADALQDNRYDRAIDALAARYQQYREVRPHHAVVIAQVRTVTGWAYSVTRSASQSALE
jgi:PPOX class probable F420-dependent enzyme